MDNKEKPVRKAVRCFLIEDEKVVVTKYKKPNPKAGYYEIPGGKIEEGETPEQAAIREFKEETGMVVSDLKRKGNMIIEYPNRIFSFEVFVTNHYVGKPRQFEENTSEWMAISEVLAKKKKLACFVILDALFRKALEEETIDFTMKINVSETEELEKMEYQVNKV